MSSTPGFHENTPLLHFAFIDESGTVGGDTGTHFLVIAAVCSDHVRDIEIIVRKAQKKLGASLASGEIKANNSKDAVILLFLIDLIKQDIQVISVAVDQKSIVLTSNDKEEIYSKAVSRMVYHLVELWPHIQICLDKRYTNRQMRFELEKRIREEIMDLPQKVVLIQQLDSQEQRGLQAADFIAWAFFQKYEKGDCRFVDILAPRIVMEEVMPPMKVKHRKI